MAASVGRARSWRSLAVTALVATAVAAASLVASGVAPRHAEGAVTSYAALVTARAPAGYWRLGETSGTTAADGSGNSRTGTYGGGITRGVVGALPADANRATTFNGSTGVVTVADAAPLRLNGAFTIELWAKLATFVNSWPGLVLKGDATTANGYLLYYRADGTVVFKRNNIEIASSAGALTTSRFSHLVVTFDGAAIRWYVNGRPASQAAATFPANGGTAALSLGRGDQFGNETLDEVAFYNAALSPTEVASHYLTGIAGVPAAGDPELMAAGDVSCAADDPNAAGNNPTVCQSFATAELIARTNPAVLAPLGDLVYGDRSLSDFQSSYGLSWGALPPSIAVHPIPGNHDYGGPHSTTQVLSAPGYYSYFPAAVSNPTGALTSGGQPVGWYSYDIGQWHVVALNGECSSVDGCAVGSPQLTWLANDLAAHPAACTVAMVHEPRWSDAGDEPEYAAVWDRLVAGRVSLVLSGHDHNSQRFGPRDGTGAPSPSGPRQFIVGSGGHDLEPFPGAGSAQFRDATHFGALKLVLHAGSYDWRFLALDGSVLDSGSAACAGSTASAYQAAVLASAPAGYWRLGEASGTVAADTSPNARTGTYSGGVVLGAPDALANDADTAATFNGTNGVMTVPDATALRLNGPFTIELWAKLTTFANTWPGLVLKGDASTANGFLIYYTSSGVVRLKRNNVEVSSGPGALSTGGYSHLVLTSDGSQVRWYVNGVLSTTTAVTFPTNAGTAALSIGRGDQFGAQSLDEVAVYPSALSAATIANHFSVGHG